MSNSNTPLMLSPPSPNAFQIPDDLLYLIFGICVDEITFENRKAPLVLSHVCQQWSRVVLGAPVLWQIIYIVGISSLTRLKNIWLPRSGSLALRVHLHFRGRIRPPGVPRFGPRNAMALMEALQHTVPRWSELSIRGVKDLAAQRILLSLYGTTSPQLTLDIRHSGQELKGDYTTVSRRLCVQLKPDLESVNINLLDLDVPNISWLNLWSHTVKQIRLGASTTGHPPPQCRSLISNLYHLLKETSQNLERIHLLVDDENKSSDTPQDVIDLPRLVHLIVIPGRSEPDRLSLPANIYPLLQRIRAPLLRNISALDLAALPTLGQFNPFPGLHELHLRDTQPHPSRLPIYAADFHATFSQLTELQRADFEGIDFSGGDLVDMFSTCCPQLVYLRFHQCNVGDGQLKSLVSKRMMNEKLLPLQHLYRSFMLGRAPGGGSWVETADFAS